MLEAAPIGDVHSVHNRSALSLTQRDGGRHQSTRRSRFPSCRRSPGATACSYHMDGARFANAGRRARLHAGRRDVAGRRGRPQLRGDQETAALPPKPWCSSSPTRPATGSSATRRKAGRPPVLQDAVPLGAARGLSGRRAVAGERGSRQRPGPAPRRRAERAARRRAGASGGDQRAVRPPAGPRC